MTIKRVANGRIKSLKRGREIILKQMVHRDGYMQIGLCKNGKTRTFQVHTLIAMTFIPNPDNKPEVNHKDTNKKNNRASNLEWNTRSENIKHAFKKRFARKKHTTYLGNEQTKIKSSKSI